MIKLCYIYKVFVLCIDNDFNFLNTGLEVDLGIYGFKLYSEVQNLKFHTSRDIISFQTSLVKM